MHHRRLNTGLVSAGSKQQLAASQASRLRGPLCCTRREKSNDLVEELGNAPGTIGVFASHLQDSEYYFKLLNNCIICPKRGQLPTCYVLVLVLHLRLPFLTERGIQPRCSQPRGNSVATPQPKALLLEHKCNLQPQKRVFLDRAN